MYCFAQGELVSNVPLHICVGSRELKRTLHPSSETLSSRKHATFTNRICRQLISSEICSIMEVYESRVNLYSESIDDLIKIQSIFKVNMKP